MNQSVAKFLDDLDRRDEERREDLIKMKPKRRNNAMPDLSKICFAELTPGEKFIVKWQFRLLGDFGKALIEAIMRADDDNLERLVMGFPLEVEAYKHYAETLGWWADVKKRANIY